MHLILASNSPRRSALLRAAGLRFTVQASQVAEVWPEGPAQQAAIAVAEQKLRGAYALWPEQAADLANTWLAADTAVMVDATALGKPRDAAQAVQMLLRLAGRAHEVVTGFVLGRGHKVLLRQAVTTEVVMRAYDEQEARRYVATGESMDKAGAYAVQGGGQALVARLFGSLSNVVGLPLEEVLVALRSLGGTSADASGV